ncbi:glutaredoxin family protein [Microbacterium sp. Au-Mic1]|uniref:glutaredoxin family protein n=1 Tax=Microbacterium sp. Au-Mic1 TaxID=2906457 RepID=UPI001E2C9BD3|nr:glutaredoxin family protein [Microbacterium sp. Au-Mic1]MCE4025331.1 glutaredoxin family protein [Microbacterium sp. Au-Mic1]
MIALTLIGKPDCHLCDVASDVIDAVVAELPDALAEDMEITELSILDDPALYEKYWEKIPVLLIDGELHGHWRISPERLREALAEKAGGAEDKGRAADAAEGEKP